MEVPHKIKNRTTALSSNPASEYISKGNEYISQYIKEISAGLCSCSIIHNNRDIEAS